MLAEIFLAAVIAKSPLAPAMMATRPNFPVAFVNGRIDDAVAERLSSLLARSPHVRTVLIESPGGNLLQAYKAAEFLEQRGIEVQVWGKCASACSMLWAAVTKRSLAEGARIGLHASAALEEPPLLLRGAVRRYSERRKSEVLHRAGFPAETISRALATPHESVLWFTPQELRALGVRFRSVPKGRRMLQGTAPNNSSQPTPLRGAA